MRRTTHRLVGFALTPVHIGDGTTLTPEGYRLGKQGGRDILERFDPPVVIAAMSDELRQRYIDVLSGGASGDPAKSLKEAQEIVQNAADDHIRERIMVSGRSEGDIKEVLTNPLRTGRINPFVRSGVSPIILGSSIKGALRTAWLAASIREQDVEKARRVLEDLIRNAEQFRGWKGNSGKAATALVNSAFEIRDGTEQDPLRDVAVSDAALASGSTVIDRVFVAKKALAGGLSPPSDMQIHVERLASIADDGAFPTKPFELTLDTVDESAVQCRARKAGARANGDDRIKRALPRRSPSFGALRDAVNSNHARIWEYEYDRFYRETGTAKVLDAILAKLELPNRADALISALNQRELWLLRIGRYGHFESKSVPQLRRGYRPQSRTPEGKRVAEGTSRSAAKDGAERLLPFGWVLLFPETAAPAEPPRLGLLPAGQRRAAPPPSSAPGRPEGGRREPSGYSNVPAGDSRALAAQLLFQKGQKVIDPVSGDIATVVENVPRTATHMSVDYGDGDGRTPTKVAGWKPAGKA